MASMRSVYYKSTIKEFFKKSQTPLAFWEIMLKYIIMKVYYKFIMENTHYKKTPGKGFC